MERRTLLRGLAAAAVAAPAVTVVGQQQAQAAAAANYYVGTTEQTKNKVLVFDKNKASWTRTSTGASVRAAAPGPNLSDIEFCATEAQGWIALMVASGGKAGIVEHRQREEHRTVTTCPGPRRREATRMRSSGSPATVGDRGRAQKARSP